MGDALWVHHLRTSQIQPAFRGNTWKKLMLAIWDPVMGHGVNLRCPAASKPGSVFLPHLQLLGSSC